MANMINLHKIVSCSILLFIRGSNDNVVHGFSTLSRSCISSRPSVAHPPQDLVRSKVSRPSAPAAAAIIAFPRPEIDFSSASLLIRKATTTDSSSPANNANNNDDTKKSKTAKRLLLVWVHLLSIFIAGNYFRASLYPSFLLAIPPPIWALIHSLAAMAFAGGVVTTTLLEWNLPSVMEKNNNNNHRGGTELLRWLFQIESLLVLPGVTFSFISGVVQSHQSYGSLRYAPRHVKSALHVMLLFGAWWVFADRRSQKDLLQGDESGDALLFDKDKVIKRRFSNVVSCLFLVVLYGIMILKPGFS